MYGFALPCAHAPPAYCFRSIDRPTDRAGWHCSSLLDDARGDGSLLTPASTVLCAAVGPGGTCRPLYGRTGPDRAGHNLTDRFTAWFEFLWCHSQRTVSFCWYLAHNRTETDALLLRIKFARLHITMYEPPTVRSRIKGYRYISPQKILFKYCSIVWMLL